MNGFTLRREDGWLLCDARATRALARRDPMSALIASGRLPGGCKLALVPARGLRVRAELPAGAESPERLAAIEAGFRAAAGARVHAAEPPLPAPRDDLARLCEESGWRFETRGDGAVAVDLDVPGAYLPALARGGAAAVEAELAAAPEDEAGRRAVAGLLLRANGSFRLVRAALRDGRFVLEAPLPAGAQAADLEAALDALAVAARGCAREAQLLAAAPDLARDYTAARGVHRSN
jgi:hypothetical protein